MKTSMKIEGAEKFLGFLERIPNEIKEKTRQSVNQRTAEMLANSKQLAPVDTGTLRRSIQCEVEEKAGVVTGEVSVGVDYGLYVETGTSKQQAQPYMKPSFDNSSNGFQSDMQKIMSEWSGGK